ncbi:MAG: Txe/YoeB family addiction module toxin [Caulobacteraceae bacterium]
MILIWSDRAWNDYLYWQDHDMKLVRKINTLLADIGRSPFRGLGLPEPLRESWAGFWSRRITDEHRLIYRIAGAGAERRIEIAQCRFHY